MGMIAETIAWNILVALMGSPNVDYRDARHAEKGTQYCSYLETRGFSEGGNFQIVSDQ